VAVHVSHLKVSEKRNWHKIDWVKKRLFEAREEGVDITADRYPYLASATGLDAVMPPWLYEGTTHDVRRRLEDRSLRKRLREGAAERFDTQEEWDTVVISLADRDENRPWEGRRLTDIARELKLDPFEAACEMLLRDNLRTSAIYFHMKEENLERILSWPFVMIGSDASAKSAEPGKATGKPHPRAFGTPARVLQEFCREKGILSLEQAVWKMTGLPADRLGLRNRGRIEAGRVADITVFDPATVADRTTYDNPFRYPAGIDHVLVNGVLSVENGQHLGKLAGRILKRE
jgi:N-acyl-D-amino-acid deacylase